MSRRSVIFLICGFVWGAVGPAWASEAPDWQSKLVKSHVQAVCEKHAAMAVPTSEVPTVLPDKNCNSEKLYYGMGVPSDATAALRCAYAERQAGNQTVFGGSAMLMMLYANGAGVEKNLDLAIKFACETGGAPAEIEGRIDHLTELQTNPAGQPLKICAEEKSLPESYCAGKVDLCDDITSGYMEGFCAGRESDLAQAAAGAALDRATTAYPLADKQALKVLEGKAEAYFSLHAAHEMDLSGTARAAQEIEEHDNMAAKFRASVVRFDAGKLPQASAADFAQADKALNAAYVTMMTKAKTQSDFTGITKDGIRQAQRAWLAYRDAWVEFARVHWPALSPDALRTWLTRQRTETLKEIPVDL